MEASMWLHDGPLIVQLILILSIGKLQADNLFLGRTGKVVLRRTIGSRVLRRPFDGTKLHAKEIVSDLASGTITICCLYLYSFLSS
jgi:hypothetical protein